MKHANLHGPTGSGPPRTNGLLTTAGGLVFSGDLDRYFSAYDGDTGDELWRVRLNDVSNSASVSYMVDGKQYVAVAVGHNRLSQARRFLVPEIRLPAQPAAYGVGVRVAMRPVDPGDCGFRRLALP